MKSCCLCGNTTPRVRFEKQGHRILECGECGLQYLDLEPPPDFFENLYQRDYFINEQAAHGYWDYFAGEAYLKKNFRRRAAIMDRHSRGGRLLDIGCGPGYFLEVLGDKWRGQGVDVSEYICGVARERGHDVTQGVFSTELFEPESFDAVTLWNALEHFPDPATVLRDINTVLRPGGVVGIYTCDAGSLFARATGPRWHLYLIPEHLVFFSRGTLRRMMQQAGFDIVKMHSETLYFSAEYLVERAAKALGAGLPRTQPGRIRQFMRQLNLPVNFFDTISCYAVKK